MTCYRVKDWNGTFEVSESRRRKDALKWVAIPTSFDGGGFRRLMRRPDGPALYGVWITVVALAGKCPERGLLRGADGPLTAEDISIRTGMDADLVVTALRVMSDPAERICWLIVEPSHDHPVDSPPAPGMVPACSLHDAGVLTGSTATTEQNGTVRYETERDITNTERSVSVSADDDSTEESSLSKTSKPNRSRSVFDWLSEETIRTTDVGKLSGWFDRVRKAPSPPEGCDSLETIVAASMKASSKENPAAYFKSLVGKGERSWIRDQDWESAKAAVRAWRQADACPELAELTAGLFGGTQ